MNRRVVVTGMSGVTALGHDWETIKENLLKGKTATRYMDEWSDIVGLRTRLAAPIQHLNIEGRWLRKKTRTMGKVSYYALSATEAAIKDSGLENDPILEGGRVGIAYGSSFGSTAPIRDFSALLYERTLRNITPASYIRMMGHTAAVNIGLFYKLKGRIIPTSVACASGSLAIGYAAEAIRYNLQDIMIAGGAEELCPSMAAVFDTLFATSTRNDTPSLTPRPYDKDRDGLVIGEGAATLILEEYEHAKKRGAPIYAELIGFGTNTDGEHITQPTPKTMSQAMHLALENANLKPTDIDFISGHGTATDTGDIAESIATYNVFGSKTPLHSLKGHFGHSLGACGALEAWLAVEMMNEGWVCPTAGLHNIDENLAPLDFIKGDIRHLEMQNVMSNNFAFGGINTSLIFRAF